MKDHLIRWANGGEFTAGDINTDDGMKTNIADTFARWETLIKEMRDKSGIFVMEGCLFQNIIRYFFPGKYAEENIVKYYDRLFEILKPADPHIIHLHRPNVPNSFHNAFKVRGAQWEYIITEGKDDYDFADEAEYQVLAGKIFTNYQGKKLSIDTSADKWEDYYKEICDFLNIKFYARQFISISNPEAFTGQFEYQKNGTIESVTVICENGELYCSPPWFTHIKMNAIGENEFVLTAFPMIFNYSFSNDCVSLTVTGDYDWGIVGKTLKRI